MAGNAAITVILMIGAIFLIASLAIGYSRSRDLLHPTVFLAPLFLAGLVVEPWLRIQHPEFTLYFPNYDGIVEVLAVQYLGMAALFIGLLSVQGPRFQGDAGRMLMDPGLTPEQKVQLRRVAWIVGIIAVLAFWYGIWSAGGFDRAYGHAKGGGRAASGYLGEAQNLGFVAVVMYALAWQGTRFRPAILLSMIFFVSPTLIHGTFGGRRGPLFISLMALFGGWILQRGKAPRMVHTALVLACVLVAVVFVQSQRSHLYLGSNEGVKLDKFWDTLQSEHIGPGENFLASAGAMKVKLETGGFHYGRRFLIIFFVRPIPRQLWPTQYEDMTSLLYSDDVSYHEIHGNVDDDAWIRILGWRSPGGFAANSIVDLFYEFGWLFIIAAALLGRFIGIAWRNFRVQGGFWNLVYLAVAVLAIYLPTQSFSAFMHRFMFLVAGSFIFWRFGVSKVARQREFADAHDRRALAQEST